MAKTRFCGIAMLLVLCCLVSAGCSESKDIEQAKTSEKTMTRQTVDSIEQHGKRPIDKARSARQMGVQRTNDIDEAVRKQ
ncbi:MAG: hypothetical protein AB2L11_03470 [Syntrophobacteraceae bacterium]